MRLNTNPDAGEAPEGLLPLLSRVADACLAAEGLSGKYQAGLTLTDEAGITGINSAQRGIDRPTDVLSFPNVRYPAGRTARACPERLRRERDPETGCMDLGDIVLCVPRAREQAAEFGHSFAREAGFLLAHGMLHLMGYDHDTDARRDAMRAMEEAIMEKAGLPRELLDEDLPLIEGAREAMRMAYTPYSKYNVGACVRAADGRVFKGCNVENASYGMTICAERNAITTAVTEGATAFTAIAIAAEGALPSPCGACRQVLREFAKDMRVLLVNREGVRVTSLSALLPESFGPESLGGVTL